jgi:hypothetical protein
VGIRRLFLVLIEMMKSQGQIDLMFCSIVGDSGWASLVETPFEACFLPPNPNMDLAGGQRIKDSIARSADRRKIPEPIVLDEPSTAIVKGRAYRSCPRISGDQHSFCVSLRSEKSETCLRIKYVLSKQVT